MAFQGAGDNQFMASSPLSAPAVATTSNILIMLWVKPTALGNQLGFVQLSHTDSNNGGSASQINLYVTAAGGWAMNVKSGTLGRVARTPQVTAPAPVAGTYHHYAVFFPAHDGNAQFATFWVDCIQAAQNGAGIPTQANAESYQFLRIGEAPFAQNQATVAHVAAFAPASIADANTLVQEAYTANHPQSITTPIAPVWAYSLDTDGTSDVGGVDLTQNGGSFVIDEPAFGSKGGASVMPIQAWL